MQYHVSPEGLLPLRALGSLAGLGLWAALAFGYPTLIGSDSYRSWVFLDTGRTGTMADLVPGGLAAVLGWIFAPGTVGEFDWRVLRTAAGLDLAGVFLGSFLFGAGTINPSIGIAGVLFVGIVGLILFGAPLFALHLPIALAWVFLVRLGCRLSGLRPADAPSGPGPE